MSTRGILRVHQSTRILETYWGHERSEIRAMSHIRIEASDTCKSYLRTIDLAQNGGAVPIVDDLGRWLERLTQAQRLELMRIFERMA